MGGGKSPSCKADIHSASQKIPWLLWNPKIHYHIHGTLILWRLTLGIRAMQ